MNSLLISVAKRTVASIFRRNFFTGITVYDSEDDGVELGAEHVLKPIEYESYTLRKHHNDRRQTLYQFGLYISACLPKYIQKIQLQHNDELEILVVPDYIYQVCSFLRLHQNCCFNQCSAATAMDVPSRVFRFEVVYMLTSLRFAERVKVKTYTDELSPLRSQYSNWQGSQIFEREIYDMFGIVFTHHPDLRRLLTDYGFTGHPLRKDFPLVGYIEVRYDDELKKLVYEPVELAQEFRKFELNTPWHYLNKFHKGYDAPLPPPPKK